MENDGILRPYEELEAQLPSMLVEELHDLTMHIGHLCELPSSVLAAFTIQHQAKVNVFYNFKFFWCDSTNSTSVCFGWIRINLSSG